MTAPILTGSIWLLYHAFLAASVRCPGNVKAG